MPTEVEFASQDRRGADPGTARRRHHRVRGGQPADRDGVARPVQHERVCGFVTLPLFALIIRCLSSACSSAAVAAVAAPEQMAAYRAPSGARGAELRRKIDTLEGASQGLRDHSDGASAPPQRPAAAAACPLIGHPSARDKSGAGYRRPAVKQFSSWSGQVRVVIVKICGLSTPEALHAALDAGADMVGFVFFPRPRRAM